MTYLWQLERGENFYRVQTDEKALADKMKRRNGFNQCAVSITNPLWIFSCEFSRPDIAKKVLSSITGAKPNFDSEGMIFYDKPNSSSEEIPV